MLLYKMDIIKNPPFPSVFGPLGKDFCFYFYLLSFLGFLSFVLILITYLYIGITKRMGFSFYMQGVAFASMYLIIYLQNRILYNMCIKTT